MNGIAIQCFLNELAELKHRSGKPNESSIRLAFICDMINHIRKDKLEYKYKHELHANEVEILPYYIANLNIEFTYMQKMGSHAEFENLCFVATLDNYVNLYKDAEMDIFNVTDENAERIKLQND